MSPWVHFAAAQKHVARIFGIDPEERLLPANIVPVALPAMFFVIFL
jgi:hypothetical protein